ncbi:hypothetical protein [Allorhizobium borbori]|uniref:Uncharacterized protein n=1 Tax=Allorhizobium borbori TaxID=485907 RepID=A0A7W6K2T9_9HYPH|nr:hypothetical protein [Allorhizobium borbori]MBB4103037.1 hypothetical protein [Allorhizobium borbori]
MTANLVAAALLLIIAYFVFAIVGGMVLFALLALRLRRGTRSRRILRCR